jgi:hypothetical protein
VSQVAAVAEAFDGRPSWFVDHWEQDPVLLDEEVVAALRDESANVIVREVMSLSERESKIVVGIVRQFEETRSEE